MEQCHFCGNKNFKDLDVEYTYKHDSKWLVMDDVPCKQCEFCGEQYFQASVLKEIELEFNAIYSHGKKVKREMSVPVGRFHDLQEKK
ncbi:MAG: hypothetical protein IEMM0008_1880 [bacterium]|nr:MAG: hypothetical protein IEMM0008_1880 [bacterium]